jgi:hypothetical protein
MARGLAGMAVLLFCVGVGALIVGLAMAGFGIPDSEFSFGNTLIVSGITSAIGGLIIIGLGAVVSQLQQVVGAIGASRSIGSDKPTENYAHTARYETPAGQMSFPLKPFTREARTPVTRESSPMTAAVSAIDEQASQSFAPTLPNPDEMPLTPTEDTSIFSSPQQLNQSTHQDLLVRAKQQDAALPKRWFANPKSDQPMAKSKIASERDLVKENIAAPAFDLSGNETGNVAVLKSGIVDGMGYTLYVDGSIEAELPQGVLRFASINELRGYLEKNS